MDRSHLSRCLAKAIAYAAPTVAKPDAVAYWLNALCQAFGHTIADTEAAERGRAYLAGKGKLD